MSVTRFLTLARERSEPKGMNDQSSGESNMRAPCCCCCCQIITPNKQPPLAPEPTLLPVSLPPLLHIILGMHRPHALHLDPRLCNLDPLPRQSRKPIGHAGGYEDLDSREEEGDG